MYKEVFFRKTGGPKKYYASSNDFSGLMIKKTLKDGYVYI